MTGKNRKRTDNQTNQGESRAPSSRSSRPAPEPEQAADVELSRAETKKTLLEIKHLKKPLMHRPGFWISASTALAAVVGALVSVIEIGDGETPANTDSVRIQAVADLLEEYRDTYVSLGERKNELMAVEIGLANTQSAELVAQERLQELQRQQREIESTVAGLFRQQEEIRAQLTTLPTSPAAGTLVIENRTQDGTCFVSVTYTSLDPSEGRCFTVQPIPSTSRAQLLACGQSYEPRGMLTWGDVESTADVVVADEAAPPMPVGVRIVRLLPNPKGPDDINETVTLKNFAADEVSLAGWSIRDIVGNSWILDESLALAPDEERELKRNGQAMSLNNTGDVVFLTDPDGLLVQRVTYDGAAEDQVIDVVQFVASKTGAFYHYPSCSAVQLINPKNLVRYQRPPAGKRLHANCPWL